MWYYNCGEEGLEERHYRRGFKPELVDEVLEVEERRVESWR